MSYVGGVYTFLVGWFGFWGLIALVPVVAFAITWYFRPSSFERMPGQPAWWQFWRRRE